LCPVNQNSIGVAVVSTAHMMMPKTSIKTTQRKKNPKNGTPSQLLEKEIEVE
jgi:hypothetical protein